MSHFAILLGGPVTVTARLRRQIAGARVIAADGGIVHAAPLGLEPELWIGDFDSSPPELIARYRHLPREVLPRDKAMTDGALAIEAARARGASALVLVGGLGGQADHVLGHYGLALRLARAGLASCLTSGNEEAHPLVPGDTGLDIAPGTRFSIVALADLDGLRIEGARWPLAGLDVALGSTLTLSNEATGPVRLALRGGYGMVLVFPLD